MTLCNSCNKLAYKFCTKPCISCGSDVHSSLSVICEQCSSKDSKCAACLKKMIKHISRGSGCSSCSRKK